MTTATKRPRGATLAVKLAQDITTVDLQLRALKKQKKALAERLTPLIRQFGEKNRSIVLDDGTRVTITTATDKRPTLTLLTDYFGKAAEAFWDQLKGRVSEYLRIEHSGLDDSGEEK